MEQVTSMCVVINEVVFMRSKKGTVKGMNEYTLVKFNEHEVASWGAELWENEQDGKFYGLMYMKKDRRVGSRGDLFSYPVKLGVEYINNMGDVRQPVWFNIGAVRFYGTWYKTCEVVKFKEVK